MAYAISYKRISTTKQGKIGKDGMRRQDQMAIDWCQKKGIELNTTLKFSDVGVSGYSGANAKKGGALHKLLAMALSGEIQKGSYVLFEAFDRMTRLPISMAQGLLSDLVNAGLIVVTLTDNREWTRRKLNDLEPFLIAILTLYRGNQESAYKSKRLREAFEAARAQGLKGKFSSIPGWLKRNEAGIVEIDEEKAGSVRRVYQLAAAGVGIKEIIQRATSEAWPIPARGSIDGGRWNRELPRRLLLSRSVLGEHEHLQYHESYIGDDGEEETRQLKMGKPTGIVVVDYYPAVISAELWAAARAAITSTARSPRRGRYYMNVFAGMLWCGCCGNAVRRRMEGRKETPKGQLMCGGKMEGITDCASMNIKMFDEPVLRAIYTHSAQYLGTIAGQDKLAGIAALRATLAERQQQLANITDAIIAGGGAVAVFVQRASKLQTDVLTLEANIAEALAIQAVAEAGSVFDDSFVDSAIAALYDEKSEQAMDARAALFLKLSLVVECAWLWAYDVALIKFKGSNALLPVALPAKSICNPKPRLRLTQAYAGALVPPVPVITTDGATRHSYPVWTQPPQPEHAGPAGWRSGMEFRALTAAEQKQVDDGHPTTPGTLPAP